MIAAVSRSLMRYAGIRAGQSSRLFLNYSASISYRFIALAHLKLHTFPNRRDFCRSLVSELTARADRIIREGLRRRGRFIEFATARRIGHFRTRLSIARILSASHVKF